MCVQEHQRILIHPPAKLPDAFDVLEVILRECQHRKPIGFRAITKFACLRAHDQLRVAAAVQAMGQQQQLALAPAKLKARVDMRDAEWSVRAHSLPLMLVWSTESFAYLRRT